MASGRRDGFEDLNVENGGLGLFNLRSVVSARINGVAAVGGAYPRQPTCA
jgi:hypothetical protein